MAAEGCYLRAGIGFDLPTETVFRDKVNCASTEPAALYGCGLGGDGAPYRSVGDFSTATGFEVGIGGTVAPAVRMEAIVEYRPRLAFSGRANFLAPERATVRGGRPRPYCPGWLPPTLTFRHWACRSSARSIPSWEQASASPGFRTGETQMMFARTTTHVPSGHRTGLAWMVTVGVATTLGKSTTLEVAWRYNDLGTVETGTGGGQVVWRDGSREPIPLDLAPTEARLRSHGLRLSVRYLF